MSFGQSYAAAGAVIGTVVPVIGTAIGAAIGGSIDLYNKWGASQAALRKAKQQFFYSLLIQYNTTVFSEAVNRIAVAMQYLVELGLKPGTPEFELALEKKLYQEIGYKRDCSIDLYKPVIPGQPRILLANISNKGDVKSYDNFVKSELGPAWVKACSELHLEALRMWAQNKADQEAFALKLKQASEDAGKQNLTTVLLFIGIILLLAGYIIKERREEWES